MKGMLGLSEMTARRADAIKARWSKYWARRPKVALLDQGMRVLRACLRQIRGGGRLIKRGEVYYVPLWLPIALALVLASTVIWGDLADAALRVSSRAAAWIQGRDLELAAFFAPSVQYWSDDINQWAAQHDVDRHLLATVMQIESCGHPTVVSSAGAQGLFQVMPFHFADGEDMRDPDTNARRGGDFLHQCYQAADGVIGLALACYNGGGSVINQERESWSGETQRYYRWGVGIYSDAVAGAARSETLDQWMAAGGSRLCTRALDELGQRAPRGSSS